MNNCGVAAVVAGVIATTFNFNKTDLSVKALFELSARLIDDLFTIGVMRTDLTLLSGSK
jgi:hypothetical protein